MRLSTRRSVSRVAVFGLLSTTPLIAGWAVTDGADGPTPRVATIVDDGAIAQLGAVQLASFSELEHNLLDVAPAVNETLRANERIEVAIDPAPGGLTADDIEAIDTSGVTVTVLREEAAPPDGQTPADDAPVAVDQVADEAPVYVAADGEAITAERIRAFLSARNAPMTELADEILAAGIAHDVDPRVIVGIAIAESNAGERLPVGSHNAWGWGGSGRFGLAHWESWDEALDYYTQRLGALYDTDDVDRSFAQTYCPPNWRWWLDTVTWVIDEI